MKTWEMMKTLMENPTLQAKSKFSNRTVKVGKSGLGDPCLVCTEMQAVAVLPLDIEWGLVPQEATWQEAIQAWLDGKKVTCRYENDETTYNAGGIVMTLYLSKESIKYGKWYIEN
jgi:hypothetical protein